MLDWLIVGGGVQGSYLSHLLTSRLGIDRDGLRVIDPLPDPLARWQQTTGNCGMQFLRSPAAHHIGLRTNELLDFARQRHANWRQLFLEPYLRPALELWNEHAQWVIEEHALAEMRVTAKVGSITAVDGAYSVQTDNGSFHSRRIIIAVGNSQALEYPQLQEGSVLVSERVRHVFDPQFERTAIRAEDDVLIVGSGVTAAQLALALAARPSGRVVMLTDRLPEITWFDSEPGWNGPRLLSRLAATVDPELRLSMVNAARVRGSFPGDTAAALLAAMLSGRVEMYVARLEHVTESAEQVRVQFRNARLEELAVDRLVYATGFSREIPALPMLEDLRRQLRLPIAGEGWPVVNEYCEWAAGLYLSGALAQLELGPVSRNISGVRTLGRRILQQFGK